jgi:hypothetical protein
MKDQTKPPQPQSEPAATLRVLLYADDLVADSSDKRLWSAVLGKIIEGRP